MYQTLEVYTVDHYFLLILRYEDIVCHLYHRKGKEP